MRIYPDETQDEELRLLGIEGFTGSLNDRQYYKLVSEGLTGSLADMIASWGSVVAPYGYILLVDSDGHYLLDVDNYYLVETI